MHFILELMPQCVLRSSLIAAGTGAVLYLLQVKSARARHAIWASVVVWMLALPVWTAWGPRAVAPLLRPAAAPAIDRPPVAQAASSVGMPVAGASQPVRTATWTWEDWIGGVYLAGFLVLIARLVIGTVRARLLLRRATNCEGRLTSVSCAVPITVGWFAPAVILPECWRRWPEAQLSAVLAHEGEHMHRRDPLVQWLALLNRAVFWFHPLAWWLERRLAALSEEACDAAVLAHGHNPFQYSEYLMEMARAMRQAGARVNLVAMSMPGASLPGRIRIILEGRTTPQISRARLTCAAVACVTLSAAFTAGAVDRAPSRPDGYGVADLKPAAVASYATPAVQPPAHKPRRAPKVLLALAPQDQRPAASTQSAAASLSGTVEDANGARIPQCAITVRDQNGADIATESTNPAGIYRFASIPPGRYSLEFSARGFARRTITAVIEPGKPSRIDAALDLGQILETVEVVAPKLAGARSTAQEAPKPGPITVGGSVKAARLLKNVPPVYPPELRQQGIAGKVIIRAVISRDGVPINPHVLNEDEVDPRLAEAALAGVSQWRYQPATLDEVAMEVTTTIAVEFRLGN